MDGSTQIKDLDKTEENKQLVRNFIENVLMKGGKPDLVSKYIGPEKPVAHGKKLVDDLEHLRSRAVDPNRPLTYDEIVLMAGQGNFVATLCKTHRMEGRTKQDFATVDIFRLENGMVVEHWDNVEPVPEKDVNGGKF